MFSLSQNLEYTFLLAGYIIVRPGEMKPMPFKIRIHIATPREVEAGPALYLMGFAGSVFPLPRIYLLRHKPLGIIGSRLMVHHGIQIYANLVPVKFLDHFLKFLFSSILGAYGPFLVELPQII